MPVGSIVLGKTFASSSEMIAHRPSSEHGSLTPTLLTLCEPALYTRVLDWEKIIPSMEKARGLVSALHR